MAGTQIQYRRGSQAQNDAFTGALGEITVDTTNRTLRVHDGTTAGGNTIVTTYASQTLLNKTLTGPTITGTLSSTGFINTSGNVSAATVLAGALTSTGFINTSGNVSAAVHTGGQVSVTGFINTTGNVSAAIGSFDSITVRAAVTAIANGGTNGVGNIGATGATFNTVFAKATTAQYADLAEIYTSDQQYPGGTVVVFGGESEVTQSHSPHDTRIAGVVSTNPAYLMNHDTVGVPVALQGRVPCRVLGPVSKGDRVVASHIAGVAQALDPLQYQPGCIIGKALQAIDSTDISIIEVVVGRL